MESQLQLALEPQALLIPLGGTFANGRSAIIDVADEHRVSGHFWIVGRDGYPRTTIQVNKTSVPVLMHYLILGDREGMFADHRNRNKLDNRRENLRLATRSQNNANRRGWASSGFKGVRQIGSRFSARIAANGKSYSLGSFETAEEAALAHDRAAREHFGEFAFLNFPSSSF